MTVYGEGIGQVYTPPISAVESTDRPEKVIETIVDNQRVTVIVRQDIVPEDPYLNMVRAAAYTWQTKKSGGRGRFPVPPVGRDIKDYLIRSNLVI